MLFRSPQPPPLPLHLALKPQDHHYRSGNAVQHLHASYMSYRNRHPTANEEIGGDGGSCGTFQHRKGTVWGSGWGIGEKRDLC